MKTLSFQENLQREPCRNSVFCKQLSSGFVKYPNCMALSAPGKDTNAIDQSREYLLNTPKLWRHSADNGCPREHHMVSTAPLETHRMLNCFLEICFFMCLPCEFVLFEHLFHIEDVLMFCYFGSGHHASPLAIPHGICGCTRGCCSVENSGLFSSPLLRSKDGSPQVPAHAWMHGQVDLLGLLHFRGGFAFVLVDSLFCGLQWWCDGLDSFLETSLEFWLMQEWKS